MALTFLRCECGCTVAGRTPEEADANMQKHKERHPKAPLKVNAPETVSVAAPEPPKKKKKVSK